MSWALRMGADLVTLLRSGMTAHYQLPDGSWCVVKIPKGPGLPDTENDEEQPRPREQDGKQKPSTKDHERGD